MSTENKNINEIKKELLSIAPTLAEIQKKEPEHVVPADYFSELPNLVIERCNTPVVKKLSDKWYIPKYYATAASIALLALCFWIFNTRNSNDLNNAFKSNNSYQIAYLDDLDDYSGITEELLVDYIIDTETNTLDIEAQEIISYLIEDEIELNTIINEYY